MTKLNRRPVFLKFENKSGHVKLPIGERIKARRKELGLTLQQLAVESGLSAAFISQAERSLTTPSVWSLLNLAKALDVDVSYFMELPQAKEIVFRADNPNRIDIGSSVEYIDLASDFPGRKLDAVLVRIPPNFSFPVGSINGEVFRYLVEGELVASAGDVKTTLKVGDGMHFDGRIPHFVSNESKADAVLLYVGTPAVLVEE